MDNKPTTSLMQQIEENARKVFPSSPVDNGVNRLYQKDDTLIKIKEETNDEIQEFAATTMSELLGWYGYDKVDSSCTKSLNLDHFTCKSNTEHSQIFHMDKNIAPSKLTSHSPISVDAPDSLFDVSNIPLSYSPNSIISMNGQLVLPSVPFKKVSPNSASKHQCENYSHTNRTDNICCIWCGKTIHTCKSERSSIFSYNMLNALGDFCSEACLVAGKTAVFKQLKTCHWCRYIQNPTNCFDYQDDESQLQFCSDNCLNQYKMHIFCHETQTHLMLQGLNNVPFHNTEEDGLITPELWFRSCQSPLSNSMEDTHFIEKHCNPNLTATLKNNRLVENDQAKKLMESKCQTSTKGDLTCIKIYTKSNNHNEKKNNCCAEINESNINGTAEKQTLVKEEIKLHEIPPRINRSEEMNLNCKNLKKTCTITDTTNHDSDVDQNSMKLLRRSIYVRHKQNLQQEHNSSKDTSRSSYCAASSTASVIQPKIPILFKSCTNKHNQLKYQDDSSLGTSASEELDQTESCYSSPSEMLSPVTVLVPYPVPLPIPIPIPIPISIPTIILDKLKNDNKYNSANTKHLNSKNVEHKGSIKRSCSIPDNTQINIRNTQTGELQHVSEYNFCPSASINGTTRQKYDNTYRLKQKTKPLRKRKHLSDTTYGTPKKFS